MDCAGDVTRLLTKYDFGAKFSRLEQDFASDCSRGWDSLLEPQRQAIMVDLFSFKREMKVRIRSRVN